MKKIILLAALALGAVSAQAQTTVEGSKFSDNWSITLKGGATTPARNYKMIPNARGVWGAEIRKQITPVFGLGVEGELTVNTSSWCGYKSNNVFDHQYVGVFGTLNLMNVFAGYAGAPRVFEIEAVAGTGWLHSYYPKYQAVEDGNSWATKAGLNFNFNLGESKAWTIGIKPAIVWNMNYLGIPETNLGNSAQFNLNHAYLELEAGITYHFVNSNGTHSFKIAQLRDEEEIAALNAQINDLRAQLDACGANNAALQSKIADLEARIRALENMPKQVETVYRDLNNQRYIFFRQGSSVIEALQQPEVEMLAKTIKDNAGSTVTIKGYASPEGSLAFNEKLSQKRADAVKNELVKKYNVAESAIESAQGCGIGDTFSNPTWNRVAICTVNTK